MSVFPAYTTVPTCADSYKRAVVQGALLLALAGLIVAQAARPPVLVHPQPTAKHTGQITAPAPRVVVTQLEVDPSVFGKEEISVRLGAATFTATRTALNTQQGIYEVRIDEGRIMKLYVRPIVQGKKSAGRRT